MLEREFVDKPSCRTLSLPFLIACGIVHIHDTLFFPCPNPFSMSAHFLFGNLRPSGPTLVKGWSFAWALGGRMSFVGECAPIHGPWLWFEGFGLSLVAKVRPGGW